MIKNINKKTKFSFLVIMIIFAVFSFTKVSFASTEVYFQKETGVVKKGDTFIVNLKISSDKNLNVVDGTITYDKDILEVKEVNKDDSLLTLWVKEPVFNNDTGELSFVGGVPNGFTPVSGQILGITFTSKKDGVTMIGLKDIFSVFVNDGKGTRVNPWLKPLSLTIDKKPNILTKININYKYYIIVLVLIILSIIIKLLIKFKTNGK